MLDYIESYNSLVVRSHSHGGEMVVNLNTTVTQGGPSSPSDVHDITYTRETTDIERKDQSKRGGGVMICLYKLQILSRRLCQACFL